MASASSPLYPRRHNPVESICRKLQSIQLCGDRQPNSPFQIPKLSSSSPRGPRAALRAPLDPVLKECPAGGRQGERGRGRAGPATRIPGCPSGGPSGGPSVKSVPGSSASSSRPAPPHPAPATPDMASISGPPEERAWRWYCSTPATLTKDSAAHFSVSRADVQLMHIEDGGRWGSPSLSRATPSLAHPLSYDLDPGSAVSSAGGLVGELPLPALVVRRLSLGDPACPTGADSRKETRAEVSLICEEDLLDTIFHACDTQRRGKVYVSCIVDYLRHTTSRTSEDSGLEELCNMLDPEHTDVSIDLDTYHAIMKEWIDDCRNNGEDPTEDLDPTKCRDALSAKRSMLLNMTSGSLEALGGEASRVELETSELVYCVADLQMNNQRLQDELRKLKQAMELMEDSNQKLAEDNQGLRNQARLSQQLAQKEKILKEEEKEEMKVTLSSTEEGRAQAHTHSKNMERENQSLIARIASLEEENIKVTMEMDDLRGRMGKLCDLNADLQVQVHSFDAVLVEKEHLILEKSRQMEELQKVVEEYSSVTELLRADKTKLETQMQMFHPDGPSLSLSVAYRLNQSASGSLQTELALAQSPPEGMLGAAVLDETLDKDVLLLLQGPNPEHMAVEFRGLLTKLKTEFRAEAVSVLSAVRRHLDHQQTPEGSTGPGLQVVQGELEARRADWVLGLDQLAQYADSLEKELIKMASNMRRSRTEILHLSVRVQEQENQKRQLSEELEQLKTPQDSKEASCQAGEELEWDAEFDLLNKEVGGKQAVVAVETVTTTTSQPEEEEKVEEEDERWTVVEDLRGGEEPRDTSTPLPAPSEEPEPGLATEGETLVSWVPMDAESGSNPQPLQDEVLWNAHTQTAGECVGQEANATLSEALHSHKGTIPPLAGSNHDYQSKPAEMDQTVVPGNTPSGTTEMVLPKSSPSISGQETIIKCGSSQPSGDPHGGGGGEEGDITSSDMSHAKSPMQLGERGELEDSSGLLPVVMEEEECSSTSVTTPGSDSSSVNVTPNAITKLQSEPSREDRLSDASQSKEQHGGPDAGQAPTDPSQAGATNEKDETSAITDSKEAAKESRNSQSPTDKEIEVEFQRLSLGFKCDLFTLEKRLRLEERSRDLAEENVRKEISSCQGLLQALIPLCDDDNQSMEIIHRLQKNLEILIQSMTRVSSRSEMLGAIHQENRVGRAVDVMFQHVENLKRMYTKEHAELLELRQTLMQSERSFGSQTDKADFRGKTQSSSQYYKPSARRVSIAAIPRSGGSPGFDSPKPQDLSESEAERLTRRSPWNVPGKGGSRPPLKRFISSGAWVDPDQSGLLMNGASYSEKLPRDPPVAERRRSSLTELGIKLTSYILPLKTPSSPPGPSSSDLLVSPSVSHTVPSHARGAVTTSGVVRGGRGLWLWLAMVVVLAGLLALLASLVMQPVVDAAPVGTGDSWMTIQQLLWPYTGLRHNGQPPV